MISISFFIPLDKIPTVTAQEAKIRVVNGKPMVYKTQVMKNAINLFRASIAPHAPEKPIEGPIYMRTCWCYPITKGHHNGEYKATRPDTDDTIKMFKDQFAFCGYWKDDAQVSVEHIEKYYATITGIFVKIQSLQEDE